MTLIFCAGRGLDYATERVEHKRRNRAPFVQRGSRLSRPRSCTGSDEFAPPEPVELGVVWKFKFGASR